MRKNGRLFAERFLYPSLYSFNPLLTHPSTKLPQRTFIIASLLNISEVKDEIPTFLHLLTLISEISLASREEEFNEFTQAALAGNLIKKFLVIFEIEDDDLQSKILEILLGLGDKLTKFLDGDDISALIHIISELLSKNHDKLATNLIKMQTYLNLVKFLTHCMKNDGVDKPSLVSCVIDSFITFISVDFGIELKIACCKFIESFIERPDLTNKLTLQAIDSIILFLTKNLLYNDSSFALLSSWLLSQLICDRTDFKRLSLHDPKISDIIFVGLSYWLEHGDECLKIECGKMLTHLVKEHPENIDIMIGSGLLCKMLELIQKDLKNSANQSYMMIVNILFDITNSSLENKKKLIKNGFITLIKNASKRNVGAEYLNYTAIKMLVNVTDTIDQELEKLMIAHDFVVAFKDLYTMIMTQCELNPESMRSQLMIGKIGEIFNNCINNSTQLLQNIVKEGMAKCALELRGVNEVSKNRLKMEMSIKSESLFN